ncbi:bifunctional UDP-N-acetylglucosamine diphosphorylase/glucosamine-1-phosphate N-acetyltransferase GlmU [Syntrophomonas erecta]
MKFSAVILAAGKGVRMKSELPKVVHRVAGKPMVAHVLKAVQEAGINQVVLVIGHGREYIEPLFPDGKVQFAIQEQQLGTGHALMQAEKLVDPESDVLVLAGDTPLIRGETIEALLEHHRSTQAAATILSTRLADPTGYGRIIRNPGGSFLRIVEEKDARGEEKKVNEINSGMYCFQAGAVFKALGRISTNNAQGEYYLTDVVEILMKENARVEVLLSNAVQDIYGVNDRVQLAQADRILRRRKNEQLMREGVTIIDPATTFVDAEVVVGRDTIIWPFTIIEGSTSIGEGCEIGPATRINDALIGNQVQIENSRIKEAHIGDQCNIGPFAYLRPDTVLHSGVKIGDFVEVKKSVIGEKSKVPHLSYVGDALVGQGVNIGAGTITCNYDGKNKYQTVLEDGVFIGSNTNLVAPVTVKENAVTGAGSTITRDVPANALAVERAQQRILADWKRKK